MALGCFVLMRAWNSYAVLTAPDHEASIATGSAAATAALCLTLIIISEPAFQPVHSSEYQVAVNVPNWANSIRTLRH